MSGTHIPYLSSIYSYLYPYIEAKTLFKPEVWGISRTDVLYMVRLPRELDTPKFNSEFNKVFNVGNLQILYVVGNIGNAGDNNVKVTGL
jgi:hypothetical protein